MKPKVTAMNVPAASLLDDEAVRSYYHDSYMAALPGAERSALAIFLDVVAATPRWVEAAMGLRNRIVERLGLKNLGHLGATPRGKPLSAYRVGDRVGIFTLLYLSEAEVVLGDADKHLDVKVSVFKQGQGAAATVSVSTVVHVHNALGRVYMFFVAPAHRVIAPAVLASGLARSAHPSATTHRKDEP